MKQDSDLEARYARLKQQAPLIPKTEQNILFERLDRDPEHIFALINEGKAGHLYLAVTHQPNLVEQANLIGQTPLHHSVMDQSGQIARILTDQPNAALWMKDIHDRRPLEAAQDYGNKAAEAQLLPLTYARAFLDQDLSQALPREISAERLNAFAKTKNNHQTQEKQKAAREKNHTRQNDKQRDHSR